MEHKNLHCAKKNINAKKKKKRSVSVLPTHETLQSQFYVMQLSVLKI